MEDNQAIVKGLNEIDKSLLAINRHLGCLTCMFVWFVFVIAVAVVSWLLEPK